MEIRQKLQLKNLLIPELSQSLKILALSSLDLRSHIENELLNNPFLEDVPPPPSLPKIKKEQTYQSSILGPDTDFSLGLLTKKLTLQDILLRQLGMFAQTNQELKIGQEIIGNIDENGYLKASIEEISLTLDVDPDRIEKTLELIQQFDPAGVAARSISECLLNQLELANEKDPQLRKIVENHIDDVAKKNYSRIAKSLNISQEKLQPLIKMILRLDPKPGRNYSAEETQHITPDITIYDKEDEFEISVNDEDIPTLNINNDYKKMLKDNTVDQQTKDFLGEKLSQAVALLRAVSRRKFTLRKIVEAIVEIQQDAIKNDLSYLKPLTFQDVAKKLNMHESTVCRTIMNKYARLPHGVIALKDFFSGQIQDKNGQSHSSNYIKKLIKELIEKEDKIHPLSDQAISKILSDSYSFNVARRTIAKYREELKILTTTFRRER